MTARTLRRESRRGFTLIETGVAGAIIIMVSLGAFAFIGQARMDEINEWHEQNALYLAEREIEAWHRDGYTGLNGFEDSESTTSTSGSGDYLPYGYTFADPDPDWNTTGRFKDVTLNDFDYRVRAQNIYNESSPESDPTNCYWHETWNNGTGDVEYYYRRVRIVIQWGRQLENNRAANEFVAETRIAR